MRQPRTGLPRSVTTAFVLLGLIVLSGCGDRYSVTGRVTFPDGTPLDEGIVICEMKDGGRVVQVRGDIGRDGQFRLGTEKPGDGARLGKYRVLVVPRGLTQAEMSVQGPIIDRKFEKFETSGLVFEVTTGKNELNITVTKPTRKK